MPSFLDQLGTRIGDATINLQQPFGLLPGQDRQGVINQGLLSLGANMLAAGGRGVNPAAAFGSAINQTQQTGQANTLRGLQTQALYENLQGARQGRKQRSTNAALLRGLFGRADPKTPANYYQTVAQLESGGDPAISNQAGSGAFGTFQIMPATYAEIRQNNPDLDLPENLTEATPEQQRTAVEALTQSNQAQLQQTLGRAPSAYETYLAHRFGAGGASELLQMDPSTSMADAMQTIFGNQAQAVIAQNPDVAQGTVADFQSRYGPQFEGTQTAQATPTQATQPQALDQLTQIRAYAEATGNNDLAQAINAVIEGRQTGIENQVAERKLELELNKLRDRQTRTQLEDEDRDAARAITQNTQTLKVIEPKYEEAVKAANDQGVIQQMDQLLNDGIFSGKFAGLETELHAYLQKLGMIDENQTVQNTQTYRTIVGQRVANIITQFGAGTGLSDADREYAAGIAGGNIELTEDALKRVLGIARETNKRILSRYDKRFAPLLKGTRFKDAFATPKAPDIPKFERNNKSPGQMTDDEIIRALGQ